MHLRVRPQGGRAPIRILLDFSGIATTSIFLDLTCTDYPDEADRHEVSFFCEGGPWPSCVYTLLRKDGTNR